ncbi:hypothetical protein [Massilibacteroides sp.]|uniref:hypothetical protein n=1 Tax=Massilibacteroides sp. TaxID=2034766 RepID=UPI002639B69A|nr:hypothetical protein [Massilibacteroides sp.]MDD4515014.1 hypothetical protein [Massilibacteroides sp.]
MKKLKNANYCCFFCIILVLSGCNKANDIFDTQKDLNSIYTDADFEYLNQINAEIFSRIEHLDIAKLEEAVLENDEEKISDMLGLSISQMAEIEGKIKSSAQSIMTKYPIIKREIIKREERKCVECETDPIMLLKLLSEKKKDIALFMRLRNAPITDERAEPKAEEPGSSGCQASGEFVACTIACAVAPVTVWAYPACVYFCYKIYCE